MIKNITSRRPIRLFEPYTSITAQHPIILSNRYKFASSNVKVCQRRTESSVSSTEEKSRTHYTLFPLTFPAGPPPAGPFKVDLARLKREFLQLQSRAHPDLHQGATRSRAEGLSAAINDAYKTLQHPLLRAQYLLSLHGIEISDYAGDDDSDQGLIVEVLGVREAIENAETEEEVRELQQENVERIRACEEKLSELFSKHHLQGATNEVGKLKYWSSIEEALRDWESGKRAV